MVAITTGLWWDHSRPAVLAATLTLSVDYGNLLISTLTLLVTMAGVSFWCIAAYTLHALSVREGPTSAVNLQHRATLRNSRGPINTFLEILKIHRAWSKTQPPFLLAQTCAVAVPAFLIWACFTVATIFTSRVANRGYSPVIARVQPDNCGFWQFNTDTPDGEAAARTKMMNDTIQARTYAQNFYSNGSSSSIARSIFVRPTLPYSVNASAPCPLPTSRRCFLGNNSAFSITTPFLDSQEMLGINAKPQDRVSVQISATCAPVAVSTDQAHYVEIANATYLQLDLGPTPSAEQNFTYLYYGDTERAGVGYLLEYDFPLLVGKISYNPND